MTTYLRNQAMIDNNIPFRCYNCKKKLITSIKGLYEIKLICPRCKTKIKIECKELIPITEGGLIK